MKLSHGFGMLIEDLNDRGSVERTALVWTSAERVYALSGHMDRQLAIAAANSIR